MPSDASNLWQPRLQGESLSVRPLDPHDFQSLFTAASDPAIWAGHPSPTRYRKAEFQQWFDAALDSGGALIVENLATHTAIGSSRYYEWDLSRSEVSIGFTFLATSHWGGKANRELKELMMRHAFSQVRTIWFHVDVRNVRSQRAMRKIGGIVSHVAEKENAGKISRYVHYKIERENPAISIATVMPPPM